MSTDRITIKNIKGAAIDKGVFGLFLEDINYAADGGIMAEMIENCSFEFFNSAPQYDYAWSVTSDNAEFKIGDKYPMNENNTHYAVISASRAMEGIKNKAYDGIYLKSGDRCGVSLYAQIHGNAVIFSLEKDGECYARTRLAESDERAECVKGAWKKYTGEVTLDRDLAQGEAVIRLEKPGTGLIDMVSLISADAAAGLFRRDITDALKMMKPGFLRFPGGCAVEGGKDLSDAYRWKDTVGEREGRRLNKSRWQNSFSPYYCQSFNLGFYEYFLLCEQLKAEPLPVVNVGLACMVNDSPEGTAVYKDPSKTYLDAREEDLADEFMSYIQDMLDLVGFANSTDFENNAYARLRKRMGHEKPFCLKLIGIGNEQWERGESRWHDRYYWAEHFLHRKDKSLKLISSAAWFHTGHEYHTNEYSFNRKMLAENPGFTFALDEHYYETPDWFYENADYYDGYGRDINVFLGEVSARWEKAPGDYTVCTLENAIAEAAYFTMTERNSDIVKMISAAPLLCRAGGKRYSQWSPNLIWYDSERIFLTPSYYVQLMYAQNGGTYNLATDVQGEGLYSNAVFDAEAGDLIVKIVNASEEEKRAEIIIDENILFKSGRAKITVLTGGKTDYNSFEAPLKAAPVTGYTEFERDKERALPPCSFTVIRLHADTK